MNFINKFAVYSFTFLIFALSGCDKNKVFHEVKKFEDFKWEKSEKINFDVLIEDIDVQYNLFINLRYIQGFPYKYLHLNISITDPNGKIKTNEVTIEIISDNKEYIGDGAGSYWDLNYPIPEYSFNIKGKYKISIEHAMEENILNWTNELGLSLFKKDLEK